MHRRNFLGCGANQRPVDGQQQDVDEKKSKEIQYNVRNLRVGFLLGVIALKLPSSGEQPETPTEAHNTHNVMAGHALPGRPV